MRTLIVLLALSFVGCGEAASSDDAGVDTPSVLGVWETAVDTVTITVTFSGSPESGAVETMQSTPISGDSATCHVELVGTGTFVVTGSSIELDTPTGVQRTVDCNDPDTETPLTDPTPLQNFAGALSGPFVLTDTTLQLGTSYPELTLVTR